jgi:hypothetical protein
MGDTATGMPDSPGGRAAFGAPPLAQTKAVAAAMRRLTGLMLSLEQPHPALDAMLARFAEWEQELALAAPTDLAPRIGDAAGDTGRIYLDHAFDIGSFNPCFPEYRFDRLDAEKASGSVVFPLPYEGPRGLVHGGFLAVFFDCVTQHHNCAAGRTGKTRTLTVAYRRPTPLLTELRFDIDRRIGERGIESTAHLTRDGDVLCIGTVATLANHVGER